MNKKLFAILGLAVILRLISLNQSLWLDEATTTKVTQLGFADYFTKLAPADFHPPLYYLLLTAWSKIFGISEVALRSLSVVAGVGIVWLTYLITELVTRPGPVTRRTGLVTALFAATSGLLIYYSQEARMYGLAAFFVTLCVYAFLKATEKEDNRWWMLFGSAVAVSVMTHYLTIFMIPVYFLWMLFSTREGKLWRGFGLSWIIPIMAFVIWSPTFIIQFTAGRNVQSTTPLWWNILGRTTLKEIGLVPTKFMLGRISIVDPLLYGLVVAVVGIVFLAILLRGLGGVREIRGKPSSTEGLIWLWLVVPVALSALLGLRLPVFSYFRLLYVLPALYILLALGVSKLKRYSGVAIAFVLLVNLLSTGAYLLNPKFHREDWRGFVNHIDNNSQGNTATIFVSNSQMEAFDYYSQHLHRSGPDGISDNYDTVWLMRYVQDVFDPEDGTRKLVEESYNKVSEHDFNGVVVWKYENRN